ncbi:Endonuclease MutS2-like protein [Drosera capensis]
MSLHVLPWRPTPLHQHRLRLLRPLATNPTIISSVQSETLETLDWPQICHHLSLFTSTTMARTSAQNSLIPIGNTREESGRLLEQTAAAMRLEGRVEFEGVEDVEGLLGKAGHGRVLGVREICGVVGTVRACRRVFEQLKVVEGGGGGGDRKYPLLEILQDCNFLIELEQKVDYCLDCGQSTVLDRASEELEFIRSERRRNMELLDSLLTSIANTIFRAGGIDRPLVTKRRSRMCVAIRASHRSLLQDGVILNASNSGATYFMEPREAVDLNNMEVRLANAEKDEEHTILSFLTSEIAASAPSIKHLLDRVQEVDLALARAGYAKWLNGVHPILDTCPVDNPLKVDIEGILHPVLLESSIRSSSDDLSTNSSLAERKIEATITEAGSDNMRAFPVPIDIKISRGTNVVIISGPNAGGKTASMKTLGLACIMSKAGMYLPARNQPKLPWFDFVLADIGDHQSLEQSLSTFSGHILRIRKILEMATKETLVLMDEIGSGTDPSEGVALSASILNYLRDRVNLTVVTTHYADLSRLREGDARFENAAMEFCLETLQPTYQILWGRAGESNALNIATTIGFDVNLIERAEHWMERLVPAKQEERKGRLYQSLLDERARLRAQASGAASLLSDVRDIYHEIYEEAKDLNWRKDALLAKETQQVQKEFEAAKSHIETVLHQYEKQVAATVTNEQLSDAFKKAKSTIESIISGHRPSMNQLTGHELSYTPQPGDEVLIKHLGNKVATVIEVSKDEKTFVVMYRNMTLRVNKSKIQLMSRRRSADDSPLQFRKQVRLLNGSH